jgi:hypothetical protein
MYGAGSEQVPQPASDAFVKAKVVDWSQRRYALGCYSSPSLGEPTSCTLLQSARLYEITTQEQSDCRLSTCNMLLLLHLQVLWSGTGRPCVLQSTTPYSLQEKLHIPQSTHACR